MEPKVSVIVPVYNSQDTIRKCVSSLLKQTLNEIEIVIVDDGSTDNSLEIAKELANDFNCIRVFHQKNKGVYNARNFGINHARGKYIFFLDSDDFLDLDTLRSLYSLSQKEKLVFSSCNHDEINSTISQAEETSESSYVAHAKEDLAKLFDLLYIKSACAKLFDRQFILDNNLTFDEKMSLGEDLNFVCRVIVLTCKVGYVGSKYYHIVNTNPYSLSKRYSRNLEYALEKQRTAWKKLLNSNKWLENKYYKTHMNFDIYLMTIYFSNLFKYDAPKLSRRKKIEKIQLFLNSHKTWLDNVKGKPQTFPQLIMFKSILSGKDRTIYLIFNLKEHLRRILFYVKKYL